jgi:hypothetical protein
LPPNYRRNGCSAAAWRRARNDFPEVPYLANYEVTVGRGIDLSFVRVADDLLETAVDCRGSAPQALL